MIQSYQRFGSVAKGYVDVVNGMCLGEETSKGGNVFLERPNDK